MVSAGLGCLGDQGLYLVQRPGQVEENRGRLHRGNADGWQHQSRHARLLHVSRC